MFEPRWVSFSPTVSSRADPGKPKVTEATADGPSAFDLADVPGHEGMGQTLGTHPKNHCGLPIPRAPPQPYGHSMPMGKWTQPGPSQVQMQTSRERAAGCASPHSQRKHSLESRKDVRRRQSAKGIMGKADEQNSGEPLRPSEDPAVPLNSTGKEQGS